VFVWNSSGAAQSLEAEGTVVLCNVMKHYPSNTVSCLKEMWIVNDICFEGPSFIEQNTSLPTVFIPLNIFDWTTELQSTHHCTDVSKQLSIPDHLAWTELLQTALCCVQVDIVHIRKIFLCKIKGIFSFCKSQNPTIKKLIYCQKNYLQYAVAVAGSSVWTWYPVSVLIWLIQISWVSSNCTTWWVAIYMYGSSLSSETRNIFWML
jgi:hypothetical protein